MKRRFLMPLLMIVICLAVFASCDMTTDLDGILNDWISSLETETGIGGGNNQFPQGDKWPQVNQGTQAETDGMVEKPDHVHTYGELLDLINNDGLPCDSRIYYQVCSVCEHKKIVYGSSADHIIEHLAGYEPTCSSDGLTDGQRCTRCGLVLVEIGRAHV